jgi:hypothetical protein
MLEATYAKRRAFATAIAGVDATFFGLDSVHPCARGPYMFDQHAFLEDVLKKAPTRQAVLDMLGLPSSRGPELFNPEHPKPRRLKLAEAVKLSEAYGVPITGPMVSADSLMPILEVSLRYPPKEWTESDVRRLAEEIEAGLKLWRSFVASRPSADRRPQASDGPDDRPRDKRD